MMEGDNEQVERCIGPSGEELDRLLTEALPDAARSLDRREADQSFLEELLEEALVASVAELTSAVEVRRTGDGRRVIPHWDRKLGDFDLTIDLGDRSAFVEAKVDDSDDMLWDLFKLATVCDQPRVVRCYLLLAKRPREWGSDQCDALFDGSGRTNQWNSLTLLTDWSSAWDDLVGPNGGSARPLSVPANLETRAVATTATKGFGLYEVRLAAVDVVDASDRLGFDGDWPSQSA